MSFVRNQKIGVKRAQRDIREYIIIYCSKNETKCTLKFQTMFDFFQY